MGGIRTTPRPMQGCVLRDPNVLSTLGKIGADPIGSSPKEFDGYMHAETTKWQPVLKAADIRAQ